MPRRPRITQLTSAQYDALERAIADGPAALRLAPRHGVRRRRGPTCASPADARRSRRIHPTTGDRLTLYIDELEGIEVVG
jgi:hypothetical protein